MIVNFYFASEDVEIADVISAVTGIVEHVLGRSVGFTFSRGFGRYITAKGHVEDETSYLLTIGNLTRVRALWFAQELAKVFKQESVGMVLLPAEFELVGPEGVRA